MTLGGGIGQLNRSLGVTSDSLIGLDIVVPNGEKGAGLIHADEDNKYSDLLWASRGGGGGNFGIATSFTYRIHPIADVTVYELTWDDWRISAACFDLARDRARCRRRIRFCLQREDRDGRPHLLPRHLSRL